ncbi:MAG: 16S rRNA (adenine(1518)-N(6)/adenine(1519)-N(6))-dimethyltransferase [Woeseia sp.]|nr:16S rRNA (adenine(1518)-N(6)/adenine(1519)-N(6))-dimethyltransferase [Woeseia sp.]|tara:strand:+ start:8410 stop:9192 length:783 start_codon:yes stop_codon:yes gene_type:complete
MLAKYPRKRFGQHFLTDKNIVNDILKAINPSNEDVIVEIGPGQGAITNKLTKNTKFLHAIEIDRDLANFLKKRFEKNSKIIIHEADALNFDYSKLGNKMRIVGNFPYNISTPLLFHLLKFKNSIIDIHCMLQKEVVDRMSAKPGNKTYGRLGIMLGCHLEIEPLFHVDRSAFFPVPKVTSTVVKLTPLKNNKFQIKDEDIFSKIVTEAFMKRRKTIQNSLKKLIKISDLDAVNLDPKLRPEQISIKKYVELSNHLVKQLS